MDAFLIESGDDLQDYSNLEKAAKLLGFLRMAFEETDFNNEENIEKWHVLGSRALQYD